VCDQLGGHAPALLLPLVVWLMSACPTEGSKGPRGESSCLRAGLQTQEDPCPQHTLPVWGGCCMGGRHLARGVSSKKAAHFMQGMKDQRWSWTNLFNFCFPGSTMLWGFPPVGGERKGLWESMALDQPQLGDVFAWAAHPRGKFPALQQGSRPSFSRPTPRPQLHTLATRRHCSSNKAFLGGGGT
jgi:hypothetical protein